MTKMDSKAAIHHTVAIELPNEVRISATTLAEPWILHLEFGAKIVQQGVTVAHALRGAADEIEHTVYLLIAAIEGQLARSEQQITIGDRVYLKGQPARTAVVHAVHEEATVDAIDNGIRVRWPLKDVVLCQ